MSILWTIIIGFVAGVIAKFIMPGDNEPSGFILTTILGAPPPDPPPDVPALSDRRTQGKVRTMRERMSQHRANPTCATCHTKLQNHEPTATRCEAC